MEINSKLGANAIRKIALLITHASDIGMDVSGYGMADENPNSGNVYLWLEEYSFTLFITLGDDAIWASWTDSNDGEEHETEAAGKTLAELESWASELANEKDRS